MLDQSVTQPEIKSNLCSSKFEKGVLSKHKYAILVPSMHWPIETLKPRLFHIQELCHLFHQADELSLVFNRCVHHQGVERAEHVAWVLGLDRGRCLEILLETRAQTVLGLAPDGSSNSAVDPERTAVRQPLRAPLPELPHTAVLVANDALRPQDLVVQMRLVSDDEGGRRAEFLERPAPLVVPAAVRLDGPQGEGLPRRRVDRHHPREERHLEHMVPRLRHREHIDPYVGDAVLADGVCDCLHLPGRHVERVPRGDRHGLGLPAVAHGERLLHAQHARLVGAQRLVQGRPPHRREHRRAELRRVCHEPKAGALPLQVMEAGRLVREEQGQSQHRQPQEPHADDPPYLDPGRQLGV
uniref:Uncharacterized protein n=1 Tax=Tetraselmis sp. GSL018 TaxID=582737 RepID=A0A061R4V1_9CHLO